jgi:pre-mRNA-splicing factor SYF2
MNSDDPSSSLEARLVRFRELCEKREEAAALNLASTKIEDAELCRDPRNQNRLLRKQAKAHKYLAKQAAKEEGIDLDRKNNLTYTVEETRQWNETLATKEARRDPGFTDFTQLTRRKYEKLADKLDTHAILHRNKEEAAEAMAQEVAKDQQQRLKHSRRRRFDETEEVTFINERNARFNKKASRAYDEYTEELRESLERGTAL